MKRSELKQIIKEEIVKILTENESKTTHKSKVDWYYINDDSDYPGPKGRTVPNAKGFDNPKEYKKTELYIKKGTKGYVKGSKFEDEDGNDVQYKAEYFEKLSENQIREIEKTLDEATVKLGSDKTFILKSDKRGVQLTKVDPNNGFQVHSEMYIFKHEIPDVINFLNSIK